MELRIESLRQFNFILSTTLAQYPDCIIEVKYNKSELSMFIIQTSMGDRAMLSITNGRESFGEVFDMDDNESKMMFIAEDFMSHVDISFMDGEYLTFKITNKGYNENNITDVNVDDEVDEEPYNLINDYRTEYLQIHNKIKTQEPIKITNYNQANSLFADFLSRDDCNKIIFEFSTEIPHMDHIFIVDLVIDKIYTYGRTLISFIVTRPDINDIRFTNNRDCVCVTPYQMNNKSMKKISEKFISRMKDCFVRCDILSEGNVEINVFSNCKLNK